MAQLKEFSLALGVINNILICDNENRILFVGDEIRGQLFKPGTEVKINDSLLDHFPDPGVREELKEKIDAARDCKCTRYFKFRNGVKDLFIFPANYAQRDSIILATEEQIRRANSIETELKERVKELQALYNVSNELELAKDLDHALEKCVGHLSAGFQYRDYLTANIKLDGRLYGDMDCIPGSLSNRLAENILTNGEIRGEVAVCYQKQAEFLEEEKDLLREVALMLSRIIERKEGRKNLENQRELLVSKNEELTHLTQDLTRTNNNFKAFLAAITDTIVVIDSDYNITQSNKEEEIGTGGKCYKKLFNSDDICENCPAADAFENGRPATIEKKHDSQYFTLQAYPIHNGDSNVETVLEICADITEEEQIKTQLIQSYKLASLGKLVAGVAHEINNPNTFIRGNIKIVNEAFGDIIPHLDRVYEGDKELKIARLKYEIFKEHVPILLDDMMGGANRIKKIVDGLRNFAKKDEGLLTDDVDVNNLIQNNLRITEKEVRKHAKLKLNLDTSVPIFKGNIQKLEQVLMNMLINASQAIEREDGLIIVETGENPEANEIYIRINDNGKGMDEDTRKHIFDPFYTTKRDKGGTGLGLSISYGIIQEHNGRIEVDSQVGAGTTFTITLPIIASVN